MNSICGNVRLCKGCRVPLRGFAMSFCPDCREDIEATYTQLMK